MRCTIKTPHGINYVYRQIVFNFYIKISYLVQTYRNDLPKRSPTFWPSTQKVSICSNSSNWLNSNIVIRVNLMKWLINYNPDNSKINKYLFQKLCRRKKISGLIPLEILCGLLCWYNRRRHKVKARFYNTRIYNFYLLPGC